MLSKVGVTVRHNDAAMRAVLERLTKERPRYVDVGAFSRKSGSLQVKIDAAHEFGATINHPGGTAYGYKTLTDAQDGRVSFLKTGEGYAVLGVTRPHKIVIRPRPYIRPTIARNRDKYSKSMQPLAMRIVEGEITKTDALGLLGQRVQGDIRKTIRALRSPALKAATIRRKGSDKPLIDKGNLVRSINYEVDSAAA